MALGFFTPPAQVSFALVDANNFYVSCERVFDYRQWDRLVVEGLIGHGNEAGGGRVGDQVAIEVLGAFGVLLRRRGEAGRDLVREQGQVVPRPVSARGVALGGVETTGRRQAKLQEHGQGSPSCR
jgi:hypothetical protein